MTELDEGLCNNPIYGAIFREFLTYLLSLKCRCITIALLFLLPDHPILLWIVDVGVTLYALFESVTFHEEELGGPYSVGNLCLRSSTSLFTWMIHSYPMFSFAGPSYPKLSMLLFNTIIYTTVRIVWNFFILVTFIKETCGHFNFQRFFLYLLGQFNVTCFGKYFQDFSQNTRNSVDKACLFLEIIVLESISREIDVVWYGGQKFAICLVALVLLPKGILLPATVPFEACLAIFGMFWMILLSGEISRTSPSCSGIIRPSIRIITDFALILVVFKLFFPLTDDSSSVEMEVLMKWIPESLIAFLITRIISNLSSFLQDNPILQLKNSARKVLNEISTFKNDDLSRSQPTELTFSVSLKSPDGDSFTKRHDVTMRDILEGRKSPLVQKKTGKGVKLYSQ